ncbi:unnamed protein product [Cuscuta europaea]|uniref:Uncharacterized protein n=1 Tax=Cuscuta europaea TaxID=41803 RepID=A0A9P1DXS8_CUSEU|nr:unnamed protein product [Cuscuta europaea]
MEKLYEELDEVKVEAEKLREECLTKTELMGTLKKVQVELSAKLQEAKLEIERLNKELCVKSKEIFEVRQLCDDTKSILQEKELLLQNLNSANQKMRVDYSDKIVKLEGENKGLLRAFDEATGKICDLEKKVSASEKEIYSLKQSLSAKKDKCVEAQLNIQSSRDLKDANGIIQKLEEENRISQEQLKWKNEQFTHLEDAHRRLHDDSQAHKAEWGKEKSELLKEISSLQISLDSQIRISKDLETELRICNQALAHEETKRKVLEMKVSELRSQCDGILLEHQETKSKLENLTFKRDEEIGELRNMLRTKETLFKETKCRSSQLEQENLELHASLKELQETILNEATARSSLKKLQTRFNSLEKLHSKCSQQYNEKEAKLRSDIEKLTQAMKECASDLKVKSKEIEMLEKDLEGCHCSMYVQNEYVSILLLVLKSEFHHVGTGKHISTELEPQNKEQDNQLFLNEQLESRENPKVYADLEEKCEEIITPTAEIQRFIEAMEESQEAALQESKGVSEALVKHNVHLAKRTTELRDIELEAEKWESSAGFMKTDLKKSQPANNMESDRVFGIIKEQDSKLSDMQQKISELESRAADVETLLKENNLLRQELSKLKNENAKSDALLTLEIEKQKLLMILEEKDKKIHNLTEEAKHLGEKLAIAETAITEKDNLLYQALQKAESSKAVEIKSKNKVIDELEGELQRLKSQFGRERKKLEGRNQELESQKNALLHDIKKLLHEREGFIVQMNGICTKLGESLEDVELTEILGKMLKHSKDEDEVDIDHTSRKVKKMFLPMQRGFEERIDERIPLKELNH